MKDTLDLNAIRKDLEEQHRHLSEQLGDEAPNLVPPSQNPDRSSLAMEYATHERDLALYEKNHYLLDQINAAIKRLDAGTYGICENCGKPIHNARLEALPYATLCIGCQMKQEVN